MCDLVNGRPYSRTPPPVKYRLADYGVGTGGAALTPLTHEDTARYAAEDVVDHYVKLHGGRNPLSVGPPLTDAEFKAFLGHTW